MSMIKQTIKKVLQERAEKEYQKELSSQMRDYDSWIRGQETPLLVYYTNKKATVAVKECEKIKKEHKNDRQKGEKAGHNDGNAGNHANGLRSPISYHVFHKEKNSSETVPILTLLELNMEQFITSLVQLRDGKIQEDVILLKLQEGIYSEFTIPLVADSFLTASSSGTDNESDDTSSVHSLMAPQFRNMPALVYGDEDVLKNDKRQNPWLKPDWSPDTFLSSFYLGAVVAMPTGKLQCFLQSSGWKLTAEEVKQLVNNKTDNKTNNTNNTMNNSKESPQLRQTIYEFLADYLYQNGAFDSWKKANEKVVHIPQVLVHTFESSYGYWKDISLSKEFAYERLKEIKSEDELPNIDVSVVIPSKDHPDVLFRCLDTFVDKTKGLWTNIRAELIIVDNGSTEDNKNKIRNKLAEDFHPSKGKINNARYLYNQIPFNFSYMCNWGAKEAKGKFLLFLNDDMEIVDPNWLALLLDKATLPYVGAVGAKLLYPDTDQIQHAGITNLRVGPAHKLQFAHDSEDHYFGQNYGVHDMLAVTGACLLVKKDIFEKVGGFDERLAVAFNDVDLCYRIYEEGHYNLVRNDVILYHHESLSRGKDGESEAKQLRLLREKDYLYEKHQELYGKDPFYHPYLTTDMVETEYTPAYRYQVDLSMPWCQVRECTEEIHAAREDACLVIGMECAMDIYKWKYGVSPEKRRLKSGDMSCRNNNVNHNGNLANENANSPENVDDKGYYFQGYSFVIGSDNACYKKELLLRKLYEEEPDIAEDVQGKPLQNQAPIYAVSIEKKYREDIKANLKDQINVDLTGYAAKMKPGILPPGKYQFGMLAKDTCSRVKLVNWSSWTIDFEE